MRKYLNIGVVTVSMVLVFAACGSNSPQDDTVTTQTHKSSSPTSTTPPVSLPSVPSGPDELKLQGFGVIREFGENDTAALFGLLTESGKLQITQVTAPSFLGGYRYGELTQAALDHLFQKSTRAMAQEERQDLIAKYKGAQVIYFEGYKGALCRPDETEFNITVSGKVDERSFKATFQFIALPNATGDCTYHKFGTLTQY